MGDVGGGAQEGTFRFHIASYVRSVFECHIFILFTTRISHHPGAGNPLLGKDLKLVVVILYEWFWRES